MAHTLEFRCAGGVVAEDGTSDGAGYEAEVRIRRVARLDGACQGDAGLHVVGLRDRVVGISVRVDVRVGGAFRLAPHGYAVGVAAKGCDVVANPFECGALVEDAEILLGVRKAAGVGKAKDVEAVVYSNDYVGLRALDPGRGQLPGDIDAANDVATSRHEEEHGEASVWGDDRGRPHGQIQAVLGRGLAHQPRRVVLVAVVDQVARGQRSAVDGRHCCHELWARRREPQRIVVVARRRELLWRQEPARHHRRLRERDGAELPRLWIFRIDESRVGARGSFHGETAGAIGRSA